MGLFKKAEVHTVKTLYVCPKCGAEKIIEYPDSESIYSGKIKIYKQVKKLLAKAKEDMVCQKCGIQMVPKTGK